MIVSTPPALEPLTLAQAKAWLRIDWDTEDELLAVLITAAREKAEHYTNRAFIAQGITETFEAYEDILLSKGDVISIDSVTVGETTLAVTDYTTYQTALGLIITPTTAPASAPTVVYTAGYGTDPDDVPKAILAAMQLMITHMYENRATTVQRLPTSAEHLLNSVRRWVT